MTLQDQTGGY